MAHDYGTDVETLVVDSLPEAFHGQYTDWRQRAKAFIAGVEARGWKIVPTEKPRPLATEVHPNAMPWYPASLDFAIKAATSKIDEWSYEADAHGYCHERPVLIALRDAALAAEQSVDEEEK